VVKTWSISAIFCSKYIREQGVHDLIWKVVGEFKFLEKSRKAPFPRFVVQMGEKNVRFCIP